MNQYRTRIKFCGITCVEDAVSAVAAGADSLGLNFYPGSARYVPVEQAYEIASAIPPFVTITGLFVDPDEEYVRKISSQVRLNLLQFHGDEPPEFCDSFEMPYIKALRLKSEEADISDTLSRYQESTGILLDTWHPDQHGGTGIRLDWDALRNLFSRETSLRFMLAGGLTPDNAGEAVRLLRPYALDVSSGIETAPGKKSAALMQSFAEAVRQADSA